MISEHLQVFGRRGHVSLSVAVVVTMTVVIHLGVAGYAVTNWHWSFAVVAAVTALLTGKVLLIVRSRTVWSRRHRPAARSGTDSA